MILIGVGARRTQIIAWFETLVSTDAQIHLVLGADERIEFLGHDDAALPLARRRELMLQRDIAEGRGFTLNQRNGDVARHHVGATQLEGGNAGLLLHIRNPDDGEFKIRLAGFANCGPLSPENLVMIRVFYMADDLVALARLHPLAMNEDHVRQASIT